MKVLNLAVSAFVFFALVAGCDDPVVGAMNDATAEVDGLTLRLSAPDTVAVTDSFEVQFVAQNRSAGDVTVKTPNSCLVLPRVTDGVGERVPLKGTGIGCLTVITTHEIPAGETIKRSFDAKAVLVTSEGEEPAPSGRYTLQARVDWTIDGEEVNLSAIKRELVVRR